MGGYATKPKPLAINFVSLDGSSLGQATNGFARESNKADRLSLRLVVPDDGQTCGRRKEQDTMSNPPPQKPLWSPKTPSESLSEQETSGEESCGKVNSFEGKLPLSISSPEPPKSRRNGEMKNPRRTQLTFRPPQAALQNDDYMCDSPRATSKPVINVASATNSGINWSRGELLGKGQFGTVYRGLNLDSGEPIALKHIHFAQETAKAKEQVAAIQNEVAILKTLKAHRNIVSYLGTDRHSLDLFILMEYVPGGSIASQIRVHGPLKETLVQKWTHEIVEGLDHLHSHEIVHRDIKGANILVTSTGSIKLADFGCAKQKFGPMSNGFTSVRGTPFWMAPEVVLGKVYGMEADVWSLGATVLEMMNGRPPWYEMGQMGALNALAKQIAVPPIPDHMSDIGKDFVLKCLDYNPANRLTCKQLLQHPWLSALEAKKDDLKEGMRAMKEIIPSPPKSEPIPMRSTVDAPPLVALSPHPPEPRLTSSIRGYSPLPSQLRFPLRPFKERGTEKKEKKTRKVLRRNSVHPDLGHSCGTPDSAHAALPWPTGIERGYCPALKTKSVDSPHLSNDELSDDEELATKGSIGFGPLMNPTPFRRKATSSHSSVGVPSSDDETSPLSPLPPSECRSSISISPLCVQVPHDCGTPQLGPLPAMSPPLPPAVALRPLPVSAAASPKRNPLRPPCRPGGSPLPLIASPKSHVDFISSSAIFATNAVRS